MDKAFNKVIKSHVVLAVLSVFAVVLLSAGVTYSLFQIDKRNTTNQKIEIGTMSGSISSIEGGIVVKDLYPQKANTITDADPKYAFTITNDGTYDLNYEVYLKDATDTLLSTTTEYNDYKRISATHYKYINYKLDGGSAENLTSNRSDDKFIVLKGTLRAGQSEDHYLQFFLDYQDTTTEGAPNDIAGSVISLDIYFDGAVTDLSGRSGETLAALGVTANGGNPDFTKTAPELTSYTDDNFVGTESSRSLSTTYQGRNFTYADSYTFNSETGTYTLVNPQVCKYSECYANLANKYIVSTSGSTSTSVANSTNVYWIYKVLSTSTLTSLKYIQSNSIPNYDSSKDGVYSMEDDYGVSYYYRGAVTNNYVKFADKFWRILRINGDGSLRVIYDGTTAHANGEESEDRFVGASAWNDNYDDAKYVGYMFGGANGEASTSKEQAQTNTTNSTMKTYLDTWYQENILATGNAKYVSDTLFCNDRSTVETPSSYGATINDTGLGYGQNITAFGYWNRITLDDESQEVIGASPTLKCAQKNDAFTVQDKNLGNGNLTYPIGLMTSDEANIAGGKVYDSTSRNIDYYLYKGSYYQLFSPTEFTDAANLFYIDGGTGDLINAPVNDENAVAPVINLSSEFIDNMIGDGTMNNPYRLKG